MAVFQHSRVLLELKNVPFKEKLALKSAVRDNGGCICFVVNEECSLVVTSDVSNLSSNRLRSIQKYQIPVVGLDYVHKCVEKGVLLPVDEYKLDTSPPAAPSPPSPPSSSETSPTAQESKVVCEPLKGPAKPAKPASLTQKAETPKEGVQVRGKFRHYTETDPDLPTFPDDFHVAKYSIFEKEQSKTWYALELQSSKGEKGWQYRVVRSRKDDVLSKKAALRDTLVFLSTSEEALEVYKDLRETMSKSGLKLRSNFPPQAQALGSDPLQQLLLEEKLNTGSSSEEVNGFVQLLWIEALDCLDNTHRVAPNKVSLNDVSRVEGLLLQAQRKLKEKKHAEVASLMDEVYTLLLQKVPPPPPTAKLISEKLDLCQLLRDVVSVREIMLISDRHLSLGMYRALRCSIEVVPPGSSEFQAVTSPLMHSTRQIKQVLRVSRGLELQTFKGELGNIRSLLHSTSPSNFVGVLSRGLLLPRVGVERHGIERTDIGNLGSGIYFSDTMSTSLKYSKQCKTDGSRLMLVCDVALGNTKDVYKRHLTLTEAPEGYNSVHGVRLSRGNGSNFLDDEYVVYSPDQVKLKYVVQFSIEGDELKEFCPEVSTPSEPSTLPSTNHELTAEDDGVESVKNPLEGVTAGLLDSSGQQLPLQAVNVKCKLLDLLSQVIIFQTYTNKSSVPIEAKYVFPLDDSAAVCGFEAFINGKHVVGQVKEKEKARKEYKQAIEKGHGAYLMDQDAPDVFTISVGNLPPGATVLIKVTYVTELIVKDGSILFSLPGSVAPWQESAALNQTTQVTVEKVCVTDEAASTREFTLDVSVEMPFQISQLRCLTHKINIKRTDCKAVVSVLPGEVMSPDGFQLSVTLYESHLPRMWVEKHPDKDSQACMLVFYPNFDTDSGSASDEVVLLIDTSESMKGESLRMAQKIALQVLKNLDHKLRLNVILFGSDHKEAFLTAQPLDEAHQAAKSFLKSFTPVGGSTELWRPLRALSLLPPSRGVRNLLLLSDGHIQNSEPTLKLLRDNVQHSRLFTCGLSPTANRHMLRALAQAGGGAYEFFDTKTKHNWAEKVASQLKRMASPGCSSVSVKWQQFNPTAPLPVQAPKQLHALFNDCHTLVYGFVPHCTQATLLGNLSGQELNTMVSTSELQKTKGTFLHKLTARAVIRDYEDGSLDTNEAEHEGKKAELKNFVVELSKEFSILSQFTSFVAIEERDSDQTEEGFTDIPKLIAEEDVDFLSYLSWTSPDDSKRERGEVLRVVDDSGSSSEEFEEEGGGMMFSRMDTVMKAEDDDDGEEEDGFPTSDISTDGSFPEESTSPKTMAMITRQVNLARSRSSMEPRPRMSLQSAYTEYETRDSDQTEEGFTDIPKLIAEEDVNFLSYHSWTSPDDSKRERGEVLLGVDDSGSSSEEFEEEGGGMMFSRMDTVMKAADDGEEEDGFPTSDISTDGSFPEESTSPKTMAMITRQVNLARSRSSMEPRPRMSLQSAYTEYETRAMITRQVNLARSRSSMEPRPRMSLQSAYTEYETRDISTDGSYTDYKRTTRLKESASPKKKSPRVETQAKAFDAPPPPPPPSTAFQAKAFDAPPPPPPPSTAFQAKAFDAPPPPPPPSTGFQAQAFGAPPPPPPSSTGFQAQAFGSLPPQPFTGFQAQACGAPPPPPSAGFQVIAFGAPPPPPSTGFQAQAFGGPPPPPSSAGFQAQAFGGPPPPPSSAGFQALATFAVKKKALHLDAEVSSSVDVLHAFDEDGYSSGSGLHRTGITIGGIEPSSKSLSFRGSAALPQVKLLDLDKILPSRRSLKFRCGVQDLEDESETAPMAGQYQSNSRMLIRNDGKARRQGRRESQGFTGIRKLRGEYGGQMLRWTKIFQLQHSEGYWEITTELGEYINVDVELFANVFLKDKGINSLGERARADILKLVATLLVLQLMRVEKLQEGKLLCTLFRLDDSSEPRPARWEELKKAVDWVCWADHQYPCVYSRLEFGMSWESSTRQLLGYEPVPHFSSLRGLTLQKNPVPLLVH
ncbi:protein mono-ADP-ribosyltransferase PARP4 isoform X3 [Notolabrus celidotus]|uniref:protein mono-ADP-ribosyltransferase PARP4 isoform X3 n=1 Tax=Notolabrus celidotus TaxID=1203425 RepID=UPI00148F9B2B|nr:protein mono-ADP-ribosyltransferase PARP4 isoform X3 [Notolabrus celidotus]